MINPHWDYLLEEEYKKEYFMKLFEFVENEYRTKQIFPKKEDVFNALKASLYSEIKTVILGQDPYHNEHQAHGYAFSVLKGVDIPPSLRNIYKELENEFHFKTKKDGDLTLLAEQGVLLLNTILTVEAHKPLSHKNKGWEQFTDAIITLLNKRETPIVFLLWGNNAIDKKKLITNPKHHIITTSHPSPLSAHRSFLGSNCFIKANQFLTENELGEIDYKVLQLKVDFQE